MLLALHILLNTLAPAENVPGVRLFMNAITGDPVLCIIIGAIVTWAVHSSVASVLLVMSLAYSHFISPSAALALVLGANLGSAINPLFEGARRDNPASYRLPVGNLINRLVGVLLVAPFLAPDHRGAAGLAARPREADGRISISHSTWRWRSSSSACSTAWRGVAEKGFSRPARGDRPVAAALSRRERARNALAGSGGRRARNPAHGRSRRSHAAQGDGGDDDERSRLGRSGVQDGQQRRQPRRSDQALCDETHARQPRRARRAAGDGDHFLRHQSRAHGRHHRQESERARDQKNQAPVPVFRRKVRRSCRHSTSEPRIRFGSRSASSCRATSTRRASFWRRRRCCAMPNLPRPNGIWIAFGKAGPRPSKPPRFILTCCATSGEFTRISARWPIPCSMPRASWRADRTRKASWSVSPEPNALPSPQQR